MSTSSAIELRVPERVTYPTAPEVLDDLSQKAGRAAFHADLSDCRHFDSSLFGVLLELLRRAGAAGAECRFGNPSGNLRKLAALYGVDELLFGRAAAR